MNIRVNQWANNGPTFLKNMPLQIYECFESTCFVLRCFNSESLVLLYNRRATIISSLRDANRAAGLGPDIDTNRSQGFILRGEF